MTATTTAKATTPDGGTTDGDRELRGSTGEVRTPFVGSDLDCSTNDGAGGETVCVRAGTLLLIAASLLACGKPTPAPAPLPGASAQPVTERPADAAQPDISEAEDVDAETESLDDADAEPEASVEAGELSAEDGFALADAAASEAMASAYLLTPALPIEWPVARARVIYLAYPLEPIKGGAVEEYTCRAASLRITLDLATRAVAVEPLPAGKKLGTLRRGRDHSPTDPILGAELALFRIARGEKTPDQSRYLLVRYAAWLEKHPLVAKDLRKRLPAFAAFVESTK